MEGSDEVGGDEIAELVQLTGLLEQQIAGFGFTGGGVSGSMTTGFIVDTPDVSNVQDQSFLGQDQSYIDQSQEA